MKSFVGEQGFGDVGPTLYKCTCNKKCIKAADYGSKPAQTFETVKSSLRFT